MASIIDNYRISSINLSKLSNFYFQAILSNIKSEKILFLEEIIFFNPNLVSPIKTEALKMKPALNFRKCMVLLILEIYRNMIFMTVSLHPQSFQKAMTMFLVKHRCMENLGSRSGAQKLKATLRPMSVSLIDLRKNLKTLIVIIKECQHWRSYFKLYWQFKPRPHRVKETSRFPTVLCQR